MLEHTCSHCGRRYELSNLPSAGERIFTSPRINIPFSEYVYATCPHCHHRDWADERRYLGVLGPRSFYALAVAFLVGFIVLVIYLGFFFKV